jgi:hypothetical protein
MWLLALEGRHEGQVLAHSKVGVDRRDLGQVAQAPFDLHRLLEDVEACHPGTPRTGRQIAAQNLHGGALAGAVGAQKAHNLALAHVERDILDGCEVAVVFGESLDLDHERGAFLWGGLGQ